MAALIQGLVSFLGLQASISAPSYGGTGKTTQKTSSKGNHESTKTLISSTSVGIRSTVLSSSARQTSILPPSGSTSATKPASSASIVTVVASSTKSAPSVSASSAKSTSSTSANTSLGQGSSSSLKPVGSSSTFGSSSLISVKPSGSSKSSSSLASSKASATSGRVSSVVIATGTSACVTTSLETVTITSTPVTTSTFYANVVFTADGDDIGGYPFNQAFTTTTDIISISTTLTVTSTVIPASLVNVTATVNQPAPSGFVPVQDSLPGAVYANGVGGPDPIPKAKKRAVAVADVRRRPRRTATGVATADTCVSTTTSVTTADTATIIFTNTEPVTEFFYPKESTTIYVYNETAIGLTSPYSTYTNVAYSFTTTYAGTFTTTTTLTAPASTTTYYEACATNNFADYVQASNGSLLPIQAVAGNWQLIGVVNVDTAYDCCAYNIVNNGSVWLFLPEASGNICGAMSPANYPVGTCLGQDSPDAQFEAGLYTKVNVLGNGYCGQVSSSGPLA